MAPLRIIPCLDVAGGRVVKGVGFTDLRDAGDPVELAAYYGEQGADEITLLDISATTQQRGTTRTVLEEVVAASGLSLTVGGGIRSLADAEALLASGADKVSIASAAVARPELIDEISEAFGSAVLVVSLDARRNPQIASGYEVMTHGGQQPSGRSALAWALEVGHRGAGELLANSIDADGTQDGFDLELLRGLRQVTSAELIASGGAGTSEHFRAAAGAGADAVLAASVFHSGALRIREVREALAAGDEFDMTRKRKRSSNPYSPK